MRRYISQAIAAPQDRPLFVYCISGDEAKHNAKHFDASWQTVSKHLRVLTECQLLKQEQSGMEIYYKV